MSEKLLEQWLEGVLSTPGLTGLADPAEARSVLLDDALRARSIVERSPGSVVDVGSGGGSPGLPLAVALPDRAFTLLEAERRKCAFLERITAEVSNVDVVWGRAEEQPPESHGVALAKALARPPVAAELCLPLVEEGGIVVLWIGESADVERVEIAARRVAGEVERNADGLLVLRKTGRTPPGFPRRPGMAKKRPLA